MVHLVYVQHSFHQGHRSADLVTLRSRLLPSRCDRLHLSEELNASLAVEIHISIIGSLVACEREHRQGYRDGNVDTNLTCLDLVLEFPGAGSRLREDSTSIAVGVADVKR
jgi:hypothetical protein